MKRPARIHARRLAARALLPALLMLCAGSVLASDRVYLQTENDEVRVVHMGAFRGWTELMLRANDNQADAYSLRETIFSPRLNLGLDGSAYHEKFLVYRLDGTVSFETRRLRGDFNRNDQLTFTEYDNAVTFFKDRNASLDLFARQNDAWVDSPFRGSYRTHVTDYGGEFRTRGPVPMSLSYSRGTRTEDYDLEIDREEKHDQLRATATQRAWFSQSDLSVRLADVTQNVQAQDYRTVGGTFDNVLRARPESVNRLRTSARYLHQYGTIDHRDFSLTEHLLVQPIPVFESTAQYQYGEQTGGASLSSGGRQLVRSHRGDVGVRHTLYGSLSTGLAYYAGREKVFDDASTGRLVGEDQRDGGRIDIGYRRNTAVGRLHLGFGYEMAREDHSSLDRARSVANEGHLMVDGDEPSLRNTGVDLSSIVVTDETGFVIYVAGVDYTVVDFGTRVRLFRVLSGGIANGQRVLVDYSFSFSPDVVFDTVGRLFSAQLDAKSGVSVHYRYSSSRQDLVSGEPGVFLEDRTLQLFGAGYRIGSLHVGDEYEINRAFDSEFESNRFFGSLDVAAFGQTRVNLGANHTWTHYTSVDRTLHVVMLTARVTSPLPGRTTLEGDGWLRVDRGEPEGAGLDADLAGIRLKVVKQMRAMLLTGGVFYRKATNNNNVEDRRANFYVALRRTF